YCIGLSDSAHQKWANIEKLRILLTKSKKNPFTAIDELYGQIFEPSKEPIADGAIESEAVTIMTIHQSKGLEFPVVVLADGESQMPMTYGDILADKDLGLAVNPRGRAVAQCAPADAL